MSIYQCTQIATECDTRKVSLKSRFTQLAILWKKLLKASSTLPLLETPGNHPSPLPKERYCLGWITLTGVWAKKKKNINFQLSRQKPGKCFPTPTTYCQNVSFQEQYIFFLSDKKKKRKKKLALFFHP